MSQRYENKEKNFIECIYFFPVEEEAAVVEFIATLDGREIKSQVRERDTQCTFCPGTFCPRRFIKSQVRETWYVLYVVSRNLLFPEI